MNGMCKLMHIQTSQWTRTWHIFRFSRSGKREVDVNHKSDCSVIFCHDPCHNSPSMCHYGIWTTRPLDNSPAIFKQLDPHSFVHYRAKRDAKYMEPRLNVIQIILRSFIHYRTNYINSSLQMKLMHTRTDSPRFDSALKNKG